MSAVATAFILSEIDLASLVSAAHPSKRLFRKAIDRFPEFVASHAQPLPDFEWSGLLFSTLLVFLEERGINLLSGSHSAQAEELRDTRQTLLCLIFAQAQRTTYLAKLEGLSTSAAELEEYFEAFTETHEPGVGEALLQGIAYLRVLLAAVTKERLVVFNVG